MFGRSVQRCLEGSCPGFLSQAGIHLVLFGFSLAVAPVPLIHEPVLTALIYTCLPEPANDIQHPYIDWRQRPPSLSSCLHPSMPQPGRNAWPGPCIWGVAPHITHCVTATLLSGLLNFLHPQDICSVSVPGSLPQISMAGSFLFMPAQITHPQSGPPSPLYLKLISVFYSFIFTSLFPSKHLFFFVSMWFSFIIHPYTPT